MPISVVFMTLEVEMLWKLWATRQVMIHPIHYSIQFTTLGSVINFFPWSLKKKGKTKKKGRQNKKENSIIINISIPYQLKYYFCYI